MKNCRDGEQISQRLGMVKGGVDMSARASDGVVLYLDCSDSCLNLIRWSGMELYTYIVWMSFPELWHYTTAT